MFTVRCVLVDYMHQPMGITDAPLFSWKLQSDKKNVLQTAYQLQMGKEGSFEQLVYDSGIVSGHQSSHLFSHELKLESLTSYCVRVKVWNNYEEETPFSEPVCFLTGLLEQSLFTASFITAESPKDRELSKGTYVRKSFSVSKPVLSARMISTALGIYHGYFNGFPIGTDEMTPGWTRYDKHLLYQTYDVTDFILQGENVWSAHLGAGWYKGTMNFDRAHHIYGDATAYFGQLLIRYEDGSEEWVVTDDTFVGADSPVLFSEIYDGEIYDARLEQTGWNKTNFDASSWHHVTILPHDVTTLTSQADCKVKELIELPVKEIIITPSGDTVLDFGQNLTGWVHMLVHGARGEEAHLQFFEVLDVEGNVYTENLRSAKQQISYICDGNGPVWYRPNFTFHGFRYIRVDSYPGDLKPENFIAYAVHSYMEDAGSFSCSNPLINQLQHNILWGLRGNFLDIPSDCPQRDERMGWTGDAQVFCRTATYLKNTYPFFRKWLHDLAAEQAPNGAVPHVVPNILSRRNADGSPILEGSMGATGWADAAVILPWTLYLHYGDTRIIKEQYQSMKAWIDFMTMHAEDGIWRFDQQFGDWVALDAAEGSYLGATPEELICTAYYAYSSSLFAKMAAAVNETEDAVEYQNLSNQIKESYQRHFIDSKGHLKARTQTAQILTLYFDLAKKEHIPVILSDLLDLLKEHDGHLVTGFLGTPYFCHALSQNGCTKEAYELLLKEDFPSWLYQVNMGATTVWEHWDGLKPDGTMWSADMNSFNHYAYGAIGEWLYRVVGGIEVDEQQPAFRHILFQPQTGGNLTWAKETYESIYGMVSCSWKTDGQEIYLEVTVPVNTTASVILEKGATVEEHAERFFA